jgi:uncharacterized protein (TIGR00369 family)
VVPNRKPRVPPNCDLTLGLKCVDKSVPGQTLWNAEPAEFMANPAGFTQGGFVAAFLDTAMASAAITNLQGRRAFAANTDMTVTFLRAVPVGEKLTCSAQVIGGDAQVTFVEGQVRDESGRLLAKSSSSYILIERSADG